MMPKGVEHPAPILVSEETTPVKIPMMPKGVEHVELDGKVRAMPNVKIPMMPKGVEHNQSNENSKLVNL